MYNRLRERALDYAMYAALVLLLAASLARYVIRHPESQERVWIFVLCILLTGLDGIGVIFPYGDKLRRGLWLTAVVTTWVVLILTAPAFVWTCAPLFYTCLRTLTLRTAIPTIGVLTFCVVIAQLRLADQFDPSLVIGPVAVAMVATAVFVEMERLHRRQGVLDERQRLARELHDTVAQGLTSQQMLLQAAERTWDTNPTKAKSLVQQAGTIAARNLEETRRFVQDLGPAELEDGRSLEEALRTLADRTTRETSFSVEFARHGDPFDVPDPIDRALFRVAQGALANVHEHSQAKAAYLTLSYLRDEHESQVVLDIRDDGVGSAAGPQRARNGRGHGLNAMRARLEQVGGTLTIESSPGQGYTLSAVVPFEEGS